MLNATLQVEIAMKRKRKPRLRTKLQCFGKTSIPCAFHSEGAHEIVLFGKYRTRNSIRRHHGGHYVTHVRFNCPCDTKAAHTTAHALGAITCRTPRALEKAIKAQVFVRKTRRGYAFAQRNPLLLSHDHFSRRAFVFQFLHAFAKRKLGLPYAAVIDVLQVNGLRIAFRLKKDAFMPHAFLINWTATKCTLNGFDYSAPLTPELEAISVRVRAILTPAFMRGLRLYHARFAGS